MKKILLKLSTTLARSIPVEKRVFLKRFLKRSDFPKYKKFKKGDSTYDLGKVLFFTSSGIHRTGNLTESLLAQTLKNSGSDVWVYRCSGELVFCNAAEWGNTDYNTFKNQGSPACGLCSSCKYQGDLYWKDSTVSRLELNLNIDVDIDSGLALDEIVAYTYRGIGIGEHAKSSTLRYLCVGELSEEHKPLLINYLKSNIALVDSLLIQLSDFNYVFCFHGIYTPHGVLTDICELLNIKLIAWNTSYRKSRFLFTWGQTYHKHFINLKESDWYKEIPEKEKDEIVKYIVGRSEGKNDWQQFNPNSSNNLDRFGNINWDKTFLLLPNVVWDAQLYFPDNYYSSMVEWVLHTIEIFKSKPDLTLIIRIHPAEIKRFSPSRQPLFEEIKKVFSDLPENIHIVKNDDKLDTHTMAKRARSILIYGSKAGIEFSALGKRVVVSGESWIKNKGFAIEPKSKKEYELLFDDLSLFKPMSEQELNRALVFANFFFEKSAIYLPEITSDINNIGLIPGKSFYNKELSEGMRLLLNKVKNNELIAYD